MLWRVGDHVRMRFHPWLLVPIALYLMVVGWITLGPEPYGATGSGLLWHALDIFGRHSSTQWLTFSVVEGLANIAMFVPLGFLLAMFFPRRLFLVAVALCVLMSMGIEAYQGSFLPTRVDDIRDVFNNGTGGLVGALVATAGRMIVAPRSRRLRAA
ncbi:MAG: hypothetical protein JWP75_3552 [Frondihabitans sp.]|nr:hypothetical protein [Frondihabitans sp.]